MRNGEVMKTGAPLLVGGTTYCSSPASIPKSQRPGIWVRVAGIRRKYSAIVLATLFGAYLILAAGIYSFQRDMLYDPDTTRPDVKSVGLQHLQEVELATSDGLRLLAWYLPPPAGRPVVVYFHGNAGNLADRSRRLRRIAEGGLGVLIPEYRGYGGNAGEPTESGLLADARAAMDFVRQKGFGADRIVLYGESLGTGLATRIASEQSVAALILQSPYTSITAIAERRFSYLPVDFMLKDRFDSLSRMPWVRAPLLILLGDRDMIVPPELSRTLFAAAQGIKELWVAPQGGHADLMQFDAGGAVIDFINRRVANSTAGALSAAGQAVGRATR